MDEIEQRITEALDGDSVAAHRVLDAARRDGVSDLTSAALVREEEWTAYGMPRIRARALVGHLQQARASAASTAAGTSGALLPTLPDDASLLAALRVGGVARVEPMDVVAVVRVAVADRLGLFQADDRILEAIEEHARALDEPCPQVYYDLQRTLARRAHAGVLLALDVPGNFVTQRRKRELLSRAGRLWDALFGFQERISAWQATWQDRVTNPGALLAGIAAMVGGGTATVPAGTLLEAPDPGPVVDAARGVVDTVNRVFAGAGIPVARALAADAMQMRELLDRTDVPQAVGASSRDELLKRLGLGVSAELVRAEQSAAQYVYTVVQLPDMPEDKLPMVIVALKELGQSLPWETLRAPTPPANARQTLR